MSDLRPSVQGVQLTVDDIGTPLADVTFVVVDLETTGGAPVDAGITEIGAVKVRGGQVLGTFGTLVNPGAPIPPFVAALTGITDALVATAPRLEAVLPGFLEFAHGAVLVAHNAPYDVGFLKGACAKLGTAWPNPAVVDTARLARTALHRDEVRNCKLGTLAAHFHASVQPTHRALDDALATTDVLHGLIERVGNFGVQTLEDLHGFTSRVTATQRAKRHLADGLPNGPGVYIFRDQRGAALYVGTSHNVRKRVRTYFTASETRRRMSEMVAIAERVDAIACATTLEARIRELRLIASEEPRYNRRSKRPTRASFVKLTAEAHPRLSVVRQVKDDHADGARYLGPFGSASLAEQAVEALNLAFDTRSCRTALPRTPKTAVAGCALAELDRCLAPCMSGGNIDGYAAQVDSLRVALAGDMRAVNDAARQRMAELAAEGRYEEAARWRERLAAALTASVRTQRTAMLAALPEVVAGRRMDDGSWEVHVIRHGSLAAAGVSRAGLDPRALVDDLLAVASDIPTPLPGQPGGLAEECDELLAWLEGHGTRLVRVAEPLAMPAECGGAELQRLKRAREASNTFIAIDNHWQAVAASRRTAAPLGPVADQVTRMKAS